MENEGGVLSSLIICFYIEYLEDETCNKHTGCSLNSTKIKYFAHAEDYASLAPLSTELRKYLIGYVRDNLV